MMFKMKFEKIHYGPISLILKNYARKTNNTAHLKNSILGYLLWGYKGGVLANMFVFLMKN